ncbi:hypothetical protein BX600DRAFT_473134 [Xylariales sp. PMI_506]|nr:hypothetical protein BX600DRAFT_473134 [Xylariales sp. PMI_506]
MVSTFGFSIPEVIAVAKIHPFYAPSIQYPPDSKDIQSARDEAAGEPTKFDLKVQPLLRKKDLYTTIERLVNDTNACNTYRNSVYVSVTGGGTGSKPMFFGTDVIENRRQRDVFGQFIRNMGIIKSGDWVVTTHTTGELYRSLDLTLEILENAGASVLGAGNYMPPADVIRIAIDFQVNVLSGESSQIVQIAHYVSSLPQEERARLEIRKIIYTSEPLTTPQREHILEVLGPVSICSILGSAEAGPYAVSNPELTGTHLGTGYEDFVFDSRLTRVEILPASFIEQGSDPEPLPDGEEGIIAQTSLTRLRHPIVRYITGDAGSLHPLPEQALALIDETHWPHLRILRFRGRDRRFSFEWDAEYIEFHRLTTLMNNPECGILQWQVILDKMDTSPEARLEVRLLRSPDAPNILPQSLLIDQVHHFFHVYASNMYRFKLLFLQTLAEFEVSTTGRKVIKFIDRFH